MKILLIFADMLRPGLLHTWNPDHKPSLTDEQIKKWGGTVYTRCYTPAPDTPRSHGCLWSGKYPKENGCDTRIKYPQWYLKKPEENFLRILKNHGYQFNFIMGESSREIGELPEDYTGCAYYSCGRPYREAFNEIVIAKDSLTYVSFKDYHYMVDDYSSRPVAGVKGNEIIGRALMMTDHALDIRQFDLVMMYSDHGWKMADESIVPMCSQLGGWRTQIFMYVRLKGDNVLKTNSKLCSIMDIGATVLELAGLEMPYSQEGISLLSDQEHKYLLIEDHKTFRVTIDQTIEIWGIRLKDNLICVNCSGEWESDIPVSDEEKDYWHQKLCKKGSFYKENIEASRILKLYAGIKSVKIYFDGTPRKSHPAFRIRIKKAVRKILTKLTNSTGLLYSKGDYESFNFKFGNREPDGITGIRTSKVYDKDQHERNDFIKADEHACTGRHL